MGKGKKKDPKCNKLNQAKKKSKKNQPIEVDEQWETTICVICGVEGEGHLVACDDCERWFHFQCVHIKNIGKDESWSCTECTSTETGKESMPRSEANEPHISEVVTTDKSPIDDPAMSENKTVDSVSKIVKMAAVNPVNEGIDSSIQDNHQSVLKSVLESLHKMIDSSNQPILPKKGYKTGDHDDRKEPSNSGIPGHINQEAQSLDGVDVSQKTRPLMDWKRGVVSEILSSTVTPEQFSEQIRTARPDNNVDPNDKIHEPKLTRDAVKVLSGNTSTSKRSTSSKNTSSSQRRVAVEIQRLEEERDLQARLDEEQLALKFEAMRLKENRERLYLQGKFKILEEECSTKKSDSQYTQSTIHSKLASDWIQNQRKQVSEPGAIVKELNASEFERKIAGLNYDISIPIDEEERDQMWREAVQRNINSKLRSKPQSKEDQDFKNLNQETGSKPFKPNEPRLELQPKDYQVPETIVPMTKKLNEKAQNFNPKARAIESNMEQSKQRDTLNEVVGTLDPMAQRLNQGQQRFGQYATDWRSELFTLNQRFDQRNGENRIFESKDPKIQSFDSNHQRFDQRNGESRIFESKDPKIQSFDSNHPRFDQRNRENRIFESKDPKIQSFDSNHQRFDQRNGENRIFESKDPKIQSFDSNHPRFDQRNRENRIFESRDPEFQSFDCNQPRFDEHGRENRIFERKDPKIQSLNSNQSRSDQQGSQYHQTSMPSESQKLSYVHAHQSMQQSRQEPMNHSQVHRSMDAQGEFHQPNDNTSNWNCNQQNQQVSPRNSSQMYQQTNGMLMEGQYGDLSAGTLPCGSRVIRTLTANQLAARHTVAKKLPWFYGDPGEWPAFIQKYTNTTNSCGLDNSENLDRLFECLKGNAREIVESQLTMPECVPSIIDTLRQKYGRPEIVIKALLTKIRAEPPIKTDKLETLSNFGYKVQNLCKTIQRQGMDFYLYNPEIVQEIVDKLPHQTKIDWARYSCDVTPITLISLSEWLMKLSQSLNRITTPEVTPRPERRSDKKSDATKSGYVNAHNEKPKKDNKSKCEICSKDCRSILGCPKFKGFSVDERWKSIYNNRAVCRRCLQVHGRNCSTSKDCGINGCVAKHHTMLHNEEKARKKLLTSKVNKVNNESSVELATGTANSANKHEDCNAHRGGQSVFYKIIPVNLKHNGKSISTYAYMDDGSGLTLMEESLAHELGLTGTPERLCLRWTSGTIRHEKDSMRVELQISGNNDEAHDYQLRNTRTIKSLDLPIQNIDRESMIKKYPYLYKVPFQEFNARPRILIGLDNIKLGLSRESVEGGWTEPVVSKTLLGWVVHGPHGLSIGKNNNHMQHHVLSISCNECPCQTRIDKEVHRQIEEYFSLEHFGIRALSNSVESKDIKRAKKIMEETIVRKNGRFEIGLLWRYDDVKLPNTYPMAIKRLECQYRKMLANPALMENINNQIKDFVAKGYVRKLTPEEINNDDPRTCYLPLFHHLDPKKPEKVRLVWDAAAKVRGISLNSMLLSGPDNLAALIDVLRRFREKSIAIGGDIQEMYHQVMIRKEDQNSQRFLWRNGDTGIVPDVYVMQVMTFGATCSPSCAQFVKNRNATDFEIEYPRAAEAIKNNHYVDDWLDCQHTVQETIQLAKDVSLIHQKGGFKLRKFISNSKEVLSVMGENSDQESKDLNINTVTSAQRVLGMWWDSQIDCFTYSLKFTKLSKDVLTRTPTKRELLKTLMSIYDPLGLIAFFLVYLKMLLQEVWKAGLGWDVPISEGLFERWKKWIKVLPKVEEIRIPRLYSKKISPGSAKSVELHVFVDASENAYCAVCYLRIQDEDGVECTLVGAKTKVTPMKPILTIPRKELLAGVLGTRLAKSIATSLTIKIDKRIFWSDSRDVLCWIRSTTRKYRQFVAFRVGEILETSMETEWRWVPGKLNVADEGTKWCKLPNFDQDCRWFRGPEFLWRNESHWPEDLTKGETTEEEIHVHFVHSKIEPQSMIDPTRFSKWWTMLKAQALSTHYVKKLVAKSRGESLSGNLKSNEKKDAEYTLYKLAQSDCFSEEIKILKNVQEQFGDKSYVHKSSPIYKFSPYLEQDGLLRVRGRIDNISQVAFDTKRPIILPRQHIITELVVIDYHTRYLHQNHKTVLNELAQKYFIPKLRVVLNSVITKCQVCKNKRAKPIVPTMGDLPKARLSPGLKPFSFTGVDYFGPMYVTVNYGTQKRWGVLFTCLTVRGIHIEIASSLTTDSCIMCVRNFMAIRGTPRELYSDNGTNFKGADAELSKEFKKLDLERIETTFTKSYSKWLFNPPSSPSMGGSWERLIRCVKDNLYHIMPTRTPTEELLRSYLMEVTNIVNSHPLIHVEIDSTDDEALTPNHFILGSSNGIKVPGEFSYDKESLKNTWKKVQELTNMFWRRWIKEYLPTLTRRSKWFPKAKPIEVGDVVLVMDERNSRNCYPKGIVVEIMPDKKGQVRSATLRTLKGMLTRPANKLAVLDIADKKEFKEVRPTADQVIRCPNGEENVENVKCSNTDQTTWNRGDTVSVTDVKRNVLPRRSKRINNAKVNKKQ